MSVFGLKGSAMRKLLLVALLVGISGLVGCATMTQSSAEVKATYRRSWQYDLRQMSDDWNHAWLLDRPSRLTRWQMR